MVSITDMSLLSIDISWQVTAIVCVLIIAISFLLCVHMYLSAKKTNNNIVDVLGHNKGNDSMETKIKNDACSTSINTIENNINVFISYPVVKVFIAGAKRLKEERSLLREELCKVGNTYNLDIRSLTFEDFATSLTGEDRGRQVDYNKFIQSEANVVIFIFDSIAGEITEEEFDVAYNSLKEDKHPDIFVYVRKRCLFSFRSIFGDGRLQKIKNKIFAHQKEYYIEYENFDNLRYLFYRDMVSYIIRIRNRQSRLGNW